MRRTAVMLALALAAGIVVGVIGDRVLNAQQQPLKRTTLLRTDLTGMEGKEALVLLVELAPGAVSPLGKHYHAGHELNYVLEGSGILELEGKPPVLMKAGQAFHIPPKQVHDPKNASQTDPLKVLVFWIAEKGQPLAVPVK